MHGFQLVLAQVCLEIGAEFMVLSMKLVLLSTTSYLKSLGSNVLTVIGGAQHYHCGCNAFLLSGGVMNHHPGNVINSVLLRKVDQTVE